MTIYELAGELDIPVYSIHWYVKIGVLPRPIGKTRAARYSIEHIKAFRAYRARCPELGNRVTAASFAERRQAGLVRL